MWNTHLFRESIDVSVPLSDRFTIFGLSVGLFRPDVNKSDIDFVFSREIILAEMGKFLAKMTPKVPFGFFKIYLYNMFAF